MPDYLTHRTMNGQPCAPTSASLCALTLTESQDFDSWKTVFDERLDARLNGNVTGHRLTRSASDPREVEVVMEFASRADAEAYRDYMEQPQTREALARAGVGQQHAPMWVGEDIETVTYP